MSGTRARERRYRVLVAPAAQKSLAAMETRMQRRVATRLERLAGDPRPSGVVKLAGDDQLWRIRVGDYRVIYAVRDRELLVLVVAIGNRRSIYRTK